MTQPESDFDAAWRRFLGLESLILAPDTIESAWTRGRSEYLAFLVRVDDPAVVDYIKPVAAQLAAIPGVEPYPEPYWHITIKGLGFRVGRPEGPEELGEDDEARIAQAARPLLESQSAFEVRIGPISGFPEVVLMEVHDAGRVRALNSLLLERVPGLFRYPYDGLVFLPHVSIARFQSAEGLSRLKQTVARLREAGAGPSFTVRGIELVRARLSQHATTFENVASYQLRG